MTTSTQLIWDDFEILVKDLIHRDLVGAGYGSEVVVEFVKGVQGGKDITVTSPHALMLFGIDFIPTTSCGLTLSIECKYHGGDKALGFERFASNTAQIAGAVVDAFLLVCNSRITPGAIYQLLMQFKCQAARPWIIDRHRLSELLLAEEVSKWIQDNAFISEIKEGVQVGLQSDVVDAIAGQVQTLTVSLINTTAETKAGSLHVQASVDWAPDNAGHSLQPYDFTLPPYGFDAYRIALRRSTPDRDDVVTMVLNLGATQFPLETSVKASGQLEVPLSFYGEAHKEALKVVGLTLLGEGNPGNSGKPRIISIAGAAGTGKSRLMEEALKTQLGLNYHRVRQASYSFGSRYKDPVSKALSRMRRAGLGIKATQEFPAEAELISGFLALPPANNQIFVLILEDVHNATPEICRQLGDLLNNDETVAEHLVLVIIGRSDFSHGNAHFDRLQEQLRVSTSSRGCHVQLDQLDPDGFRGLLNNLLSDVGEYAESVIEKLSGRVPQQVIQCVEWLMDKNRLRIFYRSAQGITDTKLFNQRLGQLPSSMIAVLSDRYQHLENKEAQLVLAAAALLGADPPSTVLNLCGEERAEGIKTLLKERQFLTEAEDGSLAWCHESLMIHFRNWLLDSNDDRQRDKPPKGSQSWAIWANKGLKQGRGAAKALLRLPDILNDLKAVDQGLIAALAGKHTTALGHWQPLLQEILSTDNWSTADIDGGNYPYMRWAFDSLATDNPKSQQLPRFAKTMTYVAGYCCSLGDGLRAADFAANRLKGLPDCYATPEEPHRVQAWLRALALHFRLDAGHMVECREEYTKLLEECGANPHLSGDKELAYEIHNCMGMLYGYLNDRERAEEYFALADNDAEALQKKELLGKQANDRTPLYQYWDFARWEKLCRLASELNAEEEGGTRRHARHASLNELLLDFHKIASHSEYADWEICLAETRNALENLLSELAGIESGCKNDSYYSLLPRLYVLKAALYYMLATCGFGSDGFDRDLMAEAERLTERGEGICLERGIGFAYWQLRNLGAMIALRRGDEQKALGKLTAAFENLKSGGLLNLGKADLSCANQLVLANYFNLLSYRNRTELAQQSLGQVQSDNGINWSLDEASQTALASAASFHALLADREPVNLLLDTSLNPPMALIAWF